MDEMEIASFGRAEDLGELDGSSESGPGKLADADGPDGDGPDDPVEDEADDDFLAEGQRLLSEAEAKLAAVERALARLDSGVYGLCEVCSGPIEPALLSEQPSLARCGQHGGPGS